MFSQYFGNYLLNNNYITREQLKDALEYQQSVRVKFGVIAVDEGFMTPEQVDEVHEKQKQVDKRFGEIAVELHYLTEEQVEYMLSVQKQNYLLLAQALVDRGYMTIEQFSGALEKYKEEHQISDDKFEEMKKGNIDILVENLLNVPNEQREIYTKYLSLFAKNMIRFVDDQVYLEIAQNRQETAEEWIVTQQIVGEKPLFTAISADEDLFLYIASKYAEEELNEVDELAKASVSEFLNLHNGIFLVNMSNEGIELNMEPQITDKNRTVSGEVFHVKVNVSKGSFYLLLSDNKEKVHF